MLAIKQEKTNAELRAEQSEDKQKQLMEKLQAVRFHATNYLPSCRYISINIFFFCLHFFFWYEIQSEEERILLLKQINAKDLELDKALERLNEANLKLSAAHDTQADVSWYFYFVIVLIPTDVIGVFLRFYLNIFVFWNS